MVVLDEAVSGRRLGTIDMISPFELSLEDGVRIVVCGIDERAREVTVEWSEVQRRASRRLVSTVSAPSAAMTPTATHSSGSEAERSPSAWPRYVAAAVIGRMPMKPVHTNRHSGTRAAPAT